MGLDRDKWLSQLKPIIDKYNNTEHRTIHMTPNQDKKKGNKLMVSFNLWNNANKNRQYPELKIGNEVRAWVKEKDGREWKMIEKIQQDELDMRKKIQQDDTDIRKEELDVRKKAISAARDVGVAYANNQPKVVYNTRVIRTWYH
jgi:hypothetical protein